MEFTNFFGIRSAKKISVLSCVNLRCKIAKCSFISVGVFGRCFCIQEHLNMDGCFASFYIFILHIVFRMVCVFYVRELSD